MTTINEQDRVKRELAAMSTIYWTLQPLTPTERARVQQWVALRLSGATSDGVPVNPFASDQERNDT